ncbi:Hypothetical protein NTJ_07743 [Nesidiocoris tenuis]|uniref:Uncharacterized protein n=1 Tax=Nesidiocoris tenuis TaxID=355587 RepID=A0ABN7AUE9_9HEMI|nr:Hypothetical protein NTJ_07743 [Nesidiocoris tenuis]
MVSSSKPPLHSVPVIFKRVDGPISTESKKKKKKHKSSSPLHLPTKFFKMEKGSKTNGKSSVSRGEVTRFGFKRPPPSPTPSPLPSVPISPADVIVQETIEPLVIAPVLPKNGNSRTNRGRKDSKMPNRFGFIAQSNQLSNKVADLQGSQGNPRTPNAIKLNNVRSLSETRYNKSVDGKVITSSSRSVEQHAAMRPSPVHYRSNDSIPSSSLAVGKLAKTAANNHMLRVSNGHLAEGAASRLKRNEDVMEIQQLEQSPGAATKFRHQTAQQKLARPMEMVFSGSKRFDVRDVPANGPSSNRGSQDLLNRTADTTSNGTAHTTHIPTTQAHSYQLNGRQSPYAPGSSISTNERIRREVVGLPPRYPTQSPSMASSVVSISSVTSPDTGDEEKLTRDTETSEKLRSGVEEEAPNEEELWAGPGEAMALDDELAVANLADIDQSPAESMNPPLRSILLTIEDPTFATLAALSNAGLLEDETAPDSPDISCSSPSSVEPLPPPPANITSKTGSPHSPGTPTHASNSSSSDTKDRDFLIDDEIADQPGLVFGSTQRQNDEPSLLDRSRTIAQLAGDVSQALHNSLHRDSFGGSAHSVSTFSPCESLASDDLIGDFDMSALDDANDLEDAPLKSEIMNQSDQVMKEWNSILTSHPSLSSGLRKTPRPRQRSAVRTATSASTVPGDASPASQASPRRTAARRIDTRSPGEENSEDSGIKLGKDTLQSMYQDVINIKNMLFMLQRVLQQETEESSIKDAKGEQGCHVHTVPGEDGLHLHDLRRQIHLLEMESEEKDLKIKKLEEAMRAINEARPPPPQRPADSPKFVNISTQTDRVRPTTTLFNNSTKNGPSSIVSSNESEKAAAGRYLQRPRLYASLSTPNVP